MLAKATCVTEDKRCASYSTHTDKMFLKFSKQLPCVIYDSFSNCSKWPLFVARQLTAETWRHCIDCVLSRAGPAVSSSYYSSIIPVLNQKS